MAFAFEQAGPYSGYIAKATGQVIAYARDPKKYRINRYTQLLKSDTELGVYYEIHPDNFVRQTGRKRRVWFDGERRPESTGNRIRHRPVEFRTIRYDYDFQIGERTAKTASYDLLMANTRSAENECMIDWTDEVVELAETAANWLGNTADAVDMAGGAKWDTGTAENPVIKMTLLDIAERITLGTNGLAADFENADDVGLILLLAPQAARRMAVVPEIHAIYKESLYAEKMTSQSSANPNAVWGLPAMLYGYKVVIENAVKVTENEQDDNTLAPTTGGASAIRRFCKSPYSAVVCSRPGGLEGTMGAPSYSTFQRYYNTSELELEIFYDGKHRYSDGHVSRDGYTVLAAPAAGWLVTSILDPE